MHLISTYIFIIELNRVNDVIQGIFGNAQSHISSSRAGSNRLENVGGWVPVQETEKCLVTGMKQDRAPCRVPASKELQVILRALGHGVDYTVDRFPRSHISVWDIRKSSEGGGKAFPGDVGEIL